MSRTLAAGILTQAAADLQAPVYLAKFTGWNGQTVRWASEGEDLQHPGGTVWTGRLFTFGDVTSGADTAATELTVEDQNLAITKLCLAASPKGCAVELSRLYLNPLTWAVVGAETLPGAFVVSGLSYPPEQVVFALRSAAELTRRQAPALLYEPGCPYLFKDALTCRYAGAVAACDRTYTACKAMENQANYGGIDLLQGAKG